MLLSIIIPTKNRATLLGKSISTFTLFKDDLEIIVVDDSSNDKNKLRNKKITKNKAKYIYNKDSKGGGNARNIGADYSSGTFLWFFDDDDYVEAKTVKDVINYLRTQKEQEVILLPMKIVDNDYVIKIIYPDIKLNNYETYRSSSHQVNTSCTIIKKESFYKVGGWDISLVSGQDTDLFLQLSIISTYDILKTSPIVIQTGHYDRITTNFKKRRTGAIQFLKKNRKILTINNKIRYIKNILYYTVQSFKK